MRSPSDHPSFVAALRDPQAPPPSDLVGRGDECPKRRFDVYRNNVHASLIDVLAARFPVVERLVGTEFFRAMARAFVSETLPQSPVLIHYGGAMASFIDLFPPAGSLPYLGDIARLEWAWHEAYHAADAEPLDVDRIAAIAAAPEQLARLRLALHPSLRTVRSDWPVLAIWRANTYDEAVRGVDLDAGGDDVLVLRPRWDVICRHLPPGGADFAEALIAGETLHSAANQAAGVSAEFDLAANLQLLLAGDAVTGAVEIRPETGR